MNRTQEHSLSAYRKLSREANPFRFTSHSNFTDTRLQFKRNFIYLMKALYLSLPSLHQQTGPTEQQPGAVLVETPIEKSVQQNRLALLQIMEHLLKVNIYRKWDILILQAGSTFQRACNTDPKAKFIGRHLDLEVQTDFMEMLIFAFLEVFPWKLNAQPQLRLPRNEEVPEQALELVQNSYIKKVRPQLSQLCQVVFEMQTLNSKNHDFQIFCMKQLALALAHYGELDQAIKIVDDQKSFNIMNSPVRHALMQHLYLEKKAKAVGKEEASHLKRNVLEAARKAYGSAISMLNSEMKKQDRVQSTESFQTRLDLKFQTFLELFLATVVESDSYSTSVKADTAIDLLQKKNKLLLHQLQSEDLILALLKVLVTAQKKTALLKEEAVQQLFERFPQNQIVMKLAAGRHTQEEDRLELMTTQLEFFANQTENPPASNWTFLSQLLEKYFSGQSLQQVLTVVRKKEWDSNLQLEFDRLKNWAFGGKIILLLKRLKKCEYDERDELTASLGAVLKVAQQLGIFSEEELAKVRSKVAKIVGCF